MEKGLAGKLLLAGAATGLAFLAAWYLDLGRPSAPAGQPAPMAEASPEYPGLIPGRGVVARSVRTESGNTILEFGSDGVRHDP
jgi:hypothetical protein